jgi:hypothetical protein
MEVYETSPDVQNGLVTLMRYTYRTDLPLFFIPLKYRHDLAYVNGEVVDAEVLGLFFYSD